MRGCVRTDAAPRGTWLGRQLSRPTGQAGRLIGHAMDAVNTRPLALTIDALPRRAGSEILEIGYGTGRGVQRLLRDAPGIRIAGIDHSPAMLAVASRRNRAAIRDGRVDLRLGSAAALPFGDQAFDGVLAINVAYFFAPSGREIAEIHRVLRPGGTTALYVTERASMASWRFAGPATHRTYDSAALHDLLRAGGFLACDITVGRVTLPFGIGGLIAIGRRGA